MPNLESNNPPVGINRNVSSNPALSGPLTGHQVRPDDPTSSYTMALAKIALRKQKVASENLEIELALIEARSEELGHLITLSETDQTVTTPPELLATQADAHTAVAKNTDTATTPHTLPKGKVILASEITIKEVNPDTFSSISFPQLMITDLSTHHFQPLDRWTKANLLAVERGQLAIPKMINPKGEANIAPRIDWSFDREKFISYTDGIEAMNYFFLGMQTAGYSQEVLDMFQGYLKGIADYPDSRSHWPVIL